MLHTRHTIAQLKTAGYTDAQVLQAGYAAAQLREAAYTAVQLKGAGYTKEQVLQAGYSAAQLKDAGYTAAQLKRSGYTATRLKDAGYLVAQMLQAGYTAVQLLEAGYTATQVTGCTNQDTRRVLPGDLLESSAPKSPSFICSHWCRGAMKAKSQARLAPIVGTGNSPFACNGVVLVPCVLEVTLTESGDSFAVRAPVTTSSPKWGSMQEVIDKQFDTLSEMLIQLPQKLVGHGGVGFDNQSPSSFELNADAFSINIPVDTINIILSDVYDMLHINTQLIAEPYSLDVYLQKGTLAKHRVAPLVDDMLGMLVICLPAYFTGGAMSVMHGAETRTFFQRSGRSCEKPLPSSDSLEWCAFFTGADVEVREIRKGIRVTVTYLLRRAGEDSPQELAPKGLALIPKPQKLQQLNLSRLDLIAHPLFSKMSVSSRSTDEILKEIRLHEKMRRAFDAGHMPALRKTVGDARFSISPGHTREIATELARTTQDMITCENAWRLNETSPSEKHEAALRLAVKQLLTSRIGPGLWNDPLYPIMATIKQDLVTKKDCIKEAKEAEARQEEYSKIV